MEASLTSLSNSSVRGNMYEAALLCWLLSHESAGGEYHGSDVGLCRKLSSMLAMTAAAASCSRNLYLSGLYSFVEGT